jgi:hypothetical protein
MPIRTKPKSTRGIPRRASNPSRKAKYARYRANSTCGLCGKLFATPAKKARHMIAEHHR